MNQFFSKIWILAIFIILFAGGILAWQYFGVPKEEGKVPKEKVSKKIVEDETVNWKIYRNEKYGFEIKYPPKYKLKEEFEEYMTEPGEKGKQLIEILLDEKIIDSHCYKSSLQKMYLRINETDNSSVSCSKEKVFVPTPSEEYKKKISLQLTKKGWPESKEINGINFYRRHFVSHAMGGKAYSDYAYQSFHDNKCYKIGIEVYSTHSFGFVDECPPSLRNSFQYKSLFKEEDKKIQEIFFPMLSTFRFFE
ncbi:MAG: hypothetical protein QME61_02700 [Patescibacteria group bacterium]|nr:hypothetical protein [Patescibacteria group bacterium]